MKRTFADILFAANEQQGYEPGDQHAHRAAAAMGDRFDAPTIIAFTDAMSFLERVGGQFHVITLRRKVDAEGNPVGDDEPGEFRTEAIRLVYESRDGRIVAAKPPEEILGVPVTDFGEPPTRIEIEAPEPTEVEPDLRDEIEAEAEAAAAPENEPEPALQE